MVGAWTVEVIGASPYEIHGDKYFELHVVRTDDPERLILAVRVPQHALAGPPTAGQRLTLTFLMGQVTGARPTPA